MKNFIVMMIMAICAIAITSCSKDDSLLGITTKPSGGGDDNNTEVTVTITRDNENGTVVAEKIENGVKKDTTVVVPLGGVSFTISPLDTIPASSAEVNEKSFSMIGDPASTPWDDKGVYYTKTIKKYQQVLDGYVKDIEISYLDAYTYVWGKRVEFPAANGNVESSEIVVLDEGINGKYHYHLATSSYKVAFMQGNSIEKGFERLAIDADDVEVGEPTVTGQGYETLSSTTAKGWIEITRTYKISGPVVTRYEVIYNNGIAAPVYEVMTLNSFVLNQVPANLSTAVVSGNRQEGNIAVTTYSQTYSVGNNVFIKGFVMSYETATLTVGIKTFEMPSRKYENVSDGNFTMVDMSSYQGFDRQLYTHNMSATFNGNSATAKAEVEIRVPEVKDEMKSREVISEGFDFVNNTTSKSWVKVRETWSVSGVKEYDKSLNVINGINSPSKITKILKDFTLTQNQANLENNARLVKTETIGDFTVKTFERKLTVNNGKFEREFVMTYQTAVCISLERDMPSREYENISDNGFNTSDLSDLDENGKRYQRKDYVHTMNASFNGQAATAKAEAELRVEIEIPRETPSWLGAPLGAKYTRVQQATGERFMDMIIFIYENGCVLAPNGNVDMSLACAYSESLAAQQGVRYSPKDVESAVWSGNQWHPAKITITNGRWIYAGMSSNSAVWSHTVHQNNAITLGIGVDVTPIPSAQNVKIDGNLITINYAVNNGKTTADSSLSLR